MKMPCFFFLLMLLSNPLSHAAEKRSLTDDIQEAREGAKEEPDKRKNQKQLHEQRMEEARERIRERYRGNRRKKPPKM